MITLICGPMFSGKSTALLQKIERGVYGKKSVALIRPKKDNRKYFTHSDGNSTLEKLIRDKKVKLYEIEGEISDEQVQTILDLYQIVCVDEYFMIKGCKKFCTTMSVLPHTDLYFAGLLSTSENTLFPEAVDILPYCDEILKLNSVCLDCGSNHGSYSAFIGAEKKDLIVVGDENLYKPVCRKCYMKLKGLL